MTTSIGSSSGFPLDPLPPTPSPAPSAEPVSPVGSEGKTTADKTLDQILPHIKSSIMRNRMRILVPLAESTLTELGTTLIATENRETFLLTKREGGLRVLQVSSQLGQGSYTRVDFVHDLIDKAQWALKLAIPKREPLPAQEGIEVDAIEGKKMPLTQALGELQTADPAQRQLSMENMQKTIDNFAIIYSNHPKDTPIRGIEAHPHEVVVLATGEVGMLAKIYRASTLAEHLLLDQTDTDKFILPTKLSELVSIAADLVAGAFHIHHVADLEYGDMKAENILLDMDDADRVVICISDIGGARPFSSLEKNGKIDTSIINYVDVTYPYIYPHYLYEQWEAISTGSLNAYREIKEKQTVWSLGVTLFRLLTLDRYETENNLPYNLGLIKTTSVPDPTVRVSPKELTYPIITPDFPRTVVERLQNQLDYPPEVANLLGGMLTMDVKARITLTEAMKQIEQICQTYRDAEPAPESRS
jgi:serine/threonine protein kinase